MALCVLFTLDTPFISGFTTQKCSLGQIETQLKLTLNCIMKPGDNHMDVFLKMVTDKYAGIKPKETNTTELCERLGEITSCFTNNIGTCFDQKINSDFTTMMEYNKYYSMKFYYNLKCNMVDGLKKDEIEQKANSIVAKYADGEILKSIFTSDKECSPKKLVVSFREFVSPAKCFVKHVLNIHALYDFIYMSYMNILNDQIMTILERSTYNTTSMPVCKSVIGILSTCFQETQCLSQPEMNFIRDFFATYYRITVSVLAQLSAKFGGMSNFIDVARVGVDDIHGIDNPTTFNEKKLQMIAKLMDWTIEDYKNDSCQKGINHFTIMVDEKLIPKLSLQDRDDGNGSYVMVDKKRIPKLPLQDKDKGNGSYVIILVLVLSFVVIIIVAMLGWVFYAYRNPTTRSGQTLIKATAKNRHHRLSIVI